MEKELHISLASIHDELLLHNENDGTDDDEVDAGNKEAMIIIILIV